MQQTTVQVERNYSSACVKNRGISLFWGLFGDVAPVSVTRGLAMETLIVVLLRALCCSSDYCTK